MSLPRTIYVAENKGGFLADNEPSGLFDDDDIEKEIGEYQLVKLAVGKKVIQFEAIGQKKRGPKPGSKRGWKKGKRQ